MPSLLPKNIEAGTTPKRSRIRARCFMARRLSPGRQVAKVAYEAVYTPAMISADGLSVNGE